MPGPDNGRRVPPCARWHGTITHRGNHMSFAYTAAALFAFPAYVTCISYGILWIVMHVYKEQYLESRSPKPFLEAMSVSWAGMYLFLFLALRRRFRSAFHRGAPAAGAGAKQKGKGKTVVFVHGAYHDESAWDFFDPIVRGLQGTAGFRFHYSIGRKDLSALALELDRFVRESVRQSGLSEVVLVGHSLGGLLARYWLARHRREAEPDCSGKAGPAAADMQVRGIITLSAPHGGMLLARLGPEPLFRGLPPCGSAVRDLENQEKRLGPCPGIHKLALYSPFDNMVTPLSCLKRTPPDWRTEELPGLSHLGLLWHPRALKAFRHALQSMGL